MLLLENDEKVILGDDWEVKKEKDSKQTINQTSSIITTNNCSKQFIKTKKPNQANTISFVSP